MPIDIATLTTTIVTSFLVPYAKMGLEKIAESATKKASEKTGEYLSDLTDKLWNRVKSAFSAPEEQPIFTLFEKNPAEMTDMLVKALQQKLEQDPNLAQLVDAPGPDGQSTGAQIMNATIAGIADLRDANLSNAQNIEISGVSIKKDDSQ
ncbi:hypothetical protein KFU94_00110 [Chloroflexi bacterium TSY]|nr:hypothetical protein [Chloroflexi bacterium TSY]